MARRLTKNEPHVWTHQTVLARCDEIGECLIWREGVTASGCPRARINGCRENVRNFVFIDVLGKELLKGYVIQPKCGNPRCLAEDCLARVKYSVWRQRIAKVVAQTPIGKRSQQQRARDAGFAKLGPDVAAEIRYSDEPSQALAQKHCVHIRTIQRIRSRQSWAPHSTPTSIFNLGG